jgi:hypothetical protein
VKIRLFSIATIIALLLTLMPLSMLAASVNVTLTDISDKSPGDTVTISGTTSLNEVIIKAIRPNTTILYYDVAVPANGGYTTSFKLPVDADLGNYTVVAGKGADVISDEFAVTTAAVVRTNANLKVLQLSEEASLDFSADKTEYTTSVGNRVTSITVSATADDTEATVTINSEETTSKQINLIEGSNPVLVEVTAQDGTTTKTYSLLIKRSATQIVAPNVPIQVSTEPLSISVPSGSTNATLQVTTVTVGTTKHATLPLIEVKVVTSFGDVSVTIPAGTQITAPANWDNIIKLPEIQSNSSVSLAIGTVSTVIEVGSPDVTLTFDKGVRLLIPNQAGKAAGYVKGSVFTPITETISADTQAAADREIVAEGDAKIDVGSDQVIWTKHFTRFASYTPVPLAPTPTPTSGSGGGSVINTNIILSNGGTVNQNGAKIVIPDGAVTSDIRVTVDKVTNTATLPTDPSLQLVSDVYEIKKDKIDEFSKSVSITLPFDKTSVDLDKSSVAVYWLNEQTNQWIQLDSTQVDIANSTVSGSVNHFTKFAVLAAVKPETSTPAPSFVNFSDIKGHWAEKSIQDLIQLGAINGYADGTFKPATNITRAEFVSIIVKAFNLPAKNGKVFADTDNHWAHNLISTAATHGIISGSDTIFGPDDLITREQMAVILVGVNKMELVADGKDYADSSDVSDWAKAAIATTTSKGLIDGFEDGTLKPKGKTTRAEAATVILRALSLKQ